MRNVHPGGGGGGHRLNRSRVPGGRRSRGQHDRVNARRRTLYNDQLPVRGDRRDRGGRDGDTDLDVYVYDEFGNLITRRQQQPTTRGHFPPVHWPVHRPQWSTAAWLYNQYRLTPLTGDGSYDPTCGSPGHSPPAWCVSTPARRPRPVGARRTGVRDPSEKFVDRLGSGADTGIPGETWPTVSHRLPIAPRRRNSIR